MNCNELLSITNEPAAEARSAALAQLFNIASDDDYWNWTAACLALDVSVYARENGMDGDGLAAMLRELSAKTLRIYIPAARHGHYARMDKRQLCATISVMKSLVNRQLAV